MNGESCWGDPITFVCRSFDGVSYFVILFISPQFFSEMALVLSVFFFSYRESSAPNGEPPEIPDLLAGWEFEEDVLIVVPTQHGRLPGRNIKKGESKVSQYTTQESSG